MRLNLVTKIFKKTMRRKARFGGWGVGRRVAGGNKQETQQRRDVQVRSLWTREAGGAAGRTESRKVLTTVSHPQSPGPGRCPRP